MTTRWTLPNGESVDLGMDRDELEDTIERANRAELIEQAISDVEYNGEPLVGLEQHVAAEKHLRANGIDPASATTEQYLDALAAWEAKTNPAPVLKKGAPLLKHDPDAAVHSEALVVLREAGVQLDENGVPLDQGVYDEAVKQARKRLGR
jgi:hypothetical protein